MRIAAAGGSKASSVKLRLRFYDRGADGSMVKLTVAYCVPMMIRQLMDGLSLGSVVEGALQADMERFKVYALQQNYQGN